MVVDSPGKARLGHRAKLIFGWRERERTEQLLMENHSHDWALKGAWYYLVLEKEQVETP